MKCPRGHFIEGQARSGRTYCLSRLFREWCERAEAAEIYVASLYSIVRSPFSSVIYNVGLCPTAECCLCIGTRQALLQRWLLCVGFVCLADVPDLVCWLIKVSIFIWCHAYLLFKQPCKMLGIGKTQFISYFTNGFVSINNSFFS
jgi:hypothetical protein